MAILIADDHPFTLQGTKAFVEALGYRVNDICSNGITALNLISIHLPDMAILDVNMPGMDGLEVAEKVYQQRLRTRVVLLTMHKEMTIYKKATEFGIYGYPLKNFAVEELGLCLKEITANRRYTSQYLDDELIYTSPGTSPTLLSKLSFFREKNIGTGSTVQNVPTDWRPVIHFGENGGRPSPQHHRKAGYS